MMTPSKFLSNACPQTREAALDEVEAKARELYQAARRRVAGRPAWENLDPNDAYDMGMREHALDMARAAQSSPPPGTKTQWWGAVAREYFERVVLSHTGDKCLIWPFSTERTQGYGVVSMDGRRVRIHREACRLTHGEPPTPAHFAVHSCGRGGQGCVSPQHVRWGTQTDNMADMVAHGTSFRGDRNPKAKLSEQAVIEIRSLCSTETRASLARRYGVSHGTIRSALRGRSWGWVK